MTKQTAKNNKFLATVKEIFNAAIFYQVSKIYNQDGEEAAKNYLTALFPPSQEDEE